MLFSLSFMLSVQAAEYPDLYWGYSGTPVQKVQAVLKQWGYYGGAVDGYYFTSTQKAVREFQKNNGLKVDGLVGKATWEAMGFFVGSSTSPKSNLQLLAQVIEGEAADEIYVGKVAVGAVIMNRLASRSFPNTLAGVIYQIDAFESVSNGQYLRRVSSDSLRAAQEALAGWDPTRGALYFWNPNKKVSSWIWSRPTIGQIGNHVFAL